MLHVNSLVNNLKTGNNSQQFSKRLLKYEEHAEKFLYFNSTDDEFSPSEEHPDHKTHL